MFWEAPTRAMLVDGPNQQLFHVAATAKCCHSHRQQQKLYVSVVPLSVQLISTRSNPHACLAACACAAHHGAACELSVYLLFETGNQHLPS